MRYGFTKDGGFVVVDDEKRISGFAFCSSPHADAAKKDQGAIARKMLGEHWAECPDRICEEHYAMSVRELAETTHPVTTE